MTPEEQEKRIQHNMKHLGLTRRQVEIHDVFMASIINTWPKSLTDFLTQIGQKYGMCGDVIAECVAAWIKGEEGSFPNENPDS